MGEFSLQLFALARTERVPIGKREQRINAMPQSICVEFTKPILIGHRSAEVLERGFQ